MPEIKKRKILFVDDEPHVLQGLQRMLHPMRKEWEMSFVGGGKAALALLEEQPFDVLVTDMRMPEMDGVQLLAKVKKEFSEVIRIVLSGYSDHRMVLMSVSLAHQFLVKPCDPKTLVSAISRASSLRDLLSNSALKQLVTQISSLPSLPTIYVQLEQVVHSEESSINYIAEIISRDVGMTAKVLQLANSAFFGLPRKINSPEEAVLFIGLRALQALILSAHIFSEFKNISHFNSFLNNLWLHSQATSGIAKVISQQETRDKTIHEHASTAGLLHDCGKLILADNFPDEYEQALALAGQERIPLWRAEEKIFGAHHGSIGAYLLGIWGFPSQVIEALAFHHQPNSFPQDQFNVLTAIHVANALEQEGRTFGEEEITIDEDYLSGLGLSGRLAEWRVLATRLNEKGASHG